MDKRHRRRSIYARRREALRSRDWPAAEPQIVLSAQRDLIPLDTRAIRHKALTDYRAAERGLDRLKGELKRYHAQDVPGFRAWMHRTFASLLTRQRELTQAIEDKRNLLIEVQSLADRYDLEDAEAYRKVQWRRAHPQEAEEEDRLFEEAHRRRAEAEDADESGDTRRDATRDEDADDPFGGDEFDDIPEHLRAEFRRLFESFGGGPNGPHSLRRSRPAPRPENKSARELYRSIVRRLHPDHHGEMSEARKSLWHETQDAYRRGDLNALYSILARCDGGETGLGAHSAVSLIVRLTLQLKKALRAAQREARQSKQDPAWDYQQRVRSPRFVRSLQYQMEEVVEQLEWQLSDIEKILSQLERRAGRPSRGKRRTGARDSGQSELPF